MSDAESSVLAADASSDAHLAEAYRRTSYVVLPDGGREIVLRIGEASVALAELLREGVEWAFVTASNPASRPLTAEENERRHDMLIERVRAAGRQSYPGEGRGDDGRWPAERSLFIRDIGEESARRLGIEFGQKAIVVGDVARREVPRLVWLS